LKAAIPAPLTDCNRHYSEPSQIMKDPAVMDHHGPWQVLQQRISTDHKRSLNSHFYKASNSIVFHRLVLQELHWRLYSFRLVISRWYLNVYSWIKSQYTTTTTSIIISRLTSKSFYHYYHSFICFFFNSCYSILK